MAVSSRTTRVEECQLKFEQYATTSVFLSGRRSGIESISWNRIAPGRWASPEEVSESTSSRTNSSPRSIFTFRSSRLMLFTMLLPQRALRSPASRPTWPVRRAPFRSTSRVRFRSFGAPFLSGSLRASEAVDGPEREYQYEDGAYGEGGGDVRRVACQEAAGGLDPTREQVQRHEHRCQKQDEEDRRAYHGASLLGA